MKKFNPVRVNHIIPKCNFFFKSTKPDSNLIKPWTKLSFFEKSTLKLRSRQSEFLKPDIHNEKPKNAREKHTCPKNEHQIRKEHKKLH